LSPAKASDPRRIRGFVSCNSPAFRIAISFTIIYIQLLIPPNAWIQISPFFPVKIFRGAVADFEPGQGQRSKKNSWFCFLQFAWIQNC
jgi:hypothetical protein